MESINEKRCGLRGTAADALCALQKFEFELVNALEKIREALGLAKDAQPERIADRAQAQTYVLDRVNGVLAQNGATGYGTVSGVAMLAGRAQTALADQKILAERNVAVSAENVKLVTELEELKRDRDNWIRTANEFHDGSSYYRALLVKIGELFGLAAKTSDDGSIQQDVLVAKVPELVEQLQKQFHTAEYQRDGWAGKYNGLLRNQRAAQQTTSAQQVQQTTPTPGYEQACKPRWRRVTAADAQTSTGPLYCWERNGEYRWCCPEWIWNDSQDKPGIGGSELVARLNRPAQPPQAEQKPEWRRVPAWDNQTSIGLLHCWHCPGFGYRWWAPGVAASFNGSGVSEVDVMKLNRDKAA